MFRKALVAGVLVAFVSVSSGAAKGEPFVLKRHTFYDPQVNNIAAGSFLVPQGWKVSGGVKWYGNNWNLTCLEAKVRNPQSYEQFESLPWATMTWMTRPIFPMRTGTNYLGSIVMKPMYPKDVIEQITIPNLRKGARVVGHYRMAEVEKLYAKKSGMTVHAVRTRIAYRIGGTAVEEDIYLILGYTSSNIGGGNVSTIWYPLATPIALRAEAGKLDAATPRMLACCHSYQPTAKWLEQWEYVHSLFRRRHNLAIQNAGELSRTISRNNDYILGLISSSYEYRNRVYARTSRNFSDYIRGVQRYHGGGYNYVLPSGYTNAWAGSNGTVILSNNPHYNPNYGGNGSWTNLRPVR